MEYTGVHCHSKSFYFHQGDCVPSQLIYFISCPYNCNLILHRMTSTTTTTINGNDGNKDEDDDDDDDESFLASLSPSSLDQLHSIQLRYKFVDHQWSSQLWQALQHAGVVYKSGPYHAKGIQVKNSKELLQWLDQCGSIPHIDNRLEMPMELDCSMTDNNEKRRVGKDIRDHVLLQFFRNQLWDHAQPHQFPTTKKYPDGTTVLDPHVTTTTNQEPPGRAKKSITVVEAGADLFLRAGKHKKRKQSQPVDNIETMMMVPQQVAATFAGTHEEAHFRADMPTTATFEDWRFLLSTNHTVVLYGLGSKHEILQNFATFIRTTYCGDVLTIQGYHRDVTFEDILDLIVHQFLDGNEPKQVQDLVIRSTGISTPALLGTHPLVRRAMAIGQGLAQRARKTKRPIFWCLHNMDGLRLRNLTVQQGVAALLVHARVTKESSGLRLLASIDHVNAPAMLWDIQTQANLAICWKQVHTFRPYLDEIQWGMEEDLRKTASQQSKSAQQSDEAFFTQVLSALSPRHSEVLRVLATLQLDSPDKPVPHHVLFQTCKHKCVVTSDTDLRSFLTELVSHGMVEKGREEGREWLKIPYSVEQLHDILAYS